MSTPQQPQPPQLPPPPQSPPLAAGGPALGAAQSAPGAQLRPPARWHDPLRLIQAEAPSESGRIVLWVVSLLTLVLLAWAAIGELDIIASAEGRLVPQTLLKVVQPAEAGVVQQLLVAEGDAVRAGQVLARLDPTVANADRAGIASELRSQQMQARRIEAELADRPMPPRAGDDARLFAQVQSQYQAHRKAYLDGVEQEKALLEKAEQERKSAAETLAKLEQTLPSYTRSADAFAKLEKEGFAGGLMASDKQREATEKRKDLDAQRAAVAALDATIAAQRMKGTQLQSAYRSDLQKELGEVKARLAQLLPNLDKTVYREGLMELKAPQDGLVKDLATTTVGAVVQPGTVVLTLVPKGEALFCDVNIKNEDVGFVQVGQRAQVKLAAYPFQRYGMLVGKVVHVGADATEPQRSAAGGGRDAAGAEVVGVSTYKARIQLERQVLVDPQGNRLALAPGMQVVAEINQGRRTVLEYLLSPVRKAVSEAGRER